MAQYKVEEDVSFVMSENGYRARNSFIVDIEINAYLIFCSSVCRLISSLFDVLQNNFTMKQRDYTLILKFKAHSGFEIKRSGYSAQKFPAQIKDK